MKKSEIYNMAMCCVINNHALSVEDKLVVIEHLMKDKWLSELSEGQTGKTENE